MALVTAERPEARTTFRSWFAILAAVALPAAADLRLEQRRTLEAIDLQGQTASTRELTEVVFLDENAARFDSGGQSFIVRSGDGVFLWLDHEARTFAETHLPVEMERLFTEEEKECVRSYPQALEDYPASVTRTGEQKSIGEWKTEKLHIEGGLRDLAFVDDRWVTHDLEVDLEPYHLLVAAKAALSPKTRGWVDELVAAGGFPVEGKTVHSIRGHQRVFRQQLGDVREVEPDETRYHRPSGYVPAAGFPLDMRCFTNTRSP